MENYTSALLDDLYHDLQEISDYDNELQCFERSYYAVESKMKQLKEFMQTYTFKDKQEEIRFFKEIKPRFQREAVYYTELFNIESKHPATTEAARKQQYEKALERVMDFFDEHRDLYNYYRSGKSSLDELYFMRSDDAPPFRPLYALDFDKSFSTPYSSVLATLQGYEQLCGYINDTIYGSNPSAPFTQQDKIHSTWSAPKVALIELAIALYFSGSVNFGQGGFKKFIVQLENFFQIKLGNVYRVFTDMVVRKKESAPFINLLGDAFKKKLEDQTM